MKGKIFNSQEVQAIIAGSKTMFREVIKPCKQHPKSLCKKTRRAHYSIDFTENGLFWQPYGGSELQPFPYCDGKLSASNSLDEFCPYQVGQKIFCKEAWGRKATGSGIAYKADNPNQLIYQHLPVKWRPAQHMKQEHSRLTLEITDVKVERLGDISEEDAIKEGVWNIQEKGSPRNWDIKNAFAIFWNATHKKPEEKFEVNPFVWVVDFKINK